MKGDGEDAVLCSFATNFHNLCSFIVSAKKNLNTLNEMNIAVVFSLFSAIFRMNLVKAEWLLELDQRVKEDKSFNRKRAGMFASRVDA